MAAAPCSAGTAGWRPHTPVPHLHRTPVPGNPSWPPIRSHPSTFTLPAAALGDFPRSIRLGGGREELESLAECHSWRRPKPHVLVVVRPCVAAAKPEQPEPGTLMPKPESSVVKSPPRNRSRTCWRRRRAALLPLHQAEPPQSPSSAPPHLLRHRLAIASLNRR
jgi:hypothetical protein